MKVKDAWRIIPRPLLETVLNGHAQKHRVAQPLILHGPRGVGKTTIILERLYEKWNTGPHITGYVDFAESIADHHPKHGNSFPWTSWSICSPPKLGALKGQLEHCLEAMVLEAIKLGAISSHQIFTTLTKWHSPTTALNQILNPKGSSLGSKVAVVNKRNRVSTSKLWDTAVHKLSARLSEQEIDGVLDRSVAVDAGSFYKEAMTSLKLAKEVIRVQEKWRENAIRDLNKKGGFSRSLANSATDWPYLLLELLSLAAEMDHFQTFGWTPAEAKIHMVGEYFTQSEWNVLVDVIGSSPRHLFEFCALKLSNYHQKMRTHEENTMEDVVDLYLAYLQVTVVNPAMDKALLLLEEFVIDGQNGKFPKDRLRFGAPWRRLPKTDDLRSWAKLQLMDFVQSLVSAEFGFNYYADGSLEIFDDPSAIALIQVGLLYVQRDPPLIRPVTRGIQRCLVRWLVQEQMSLSLIDSLQYRCQRVVRGRSYRHLML